MAKNSNVWKVSDLATAPIAFAVWGLLLSLMFYFREKLGLAESQTLLASIAVIAGLVSQGIKFITADRPSKQWEALFASLAIILGVIALYGELS
ncbi:hypothetical protein ABMC88_12185 [Sulfitobacter sp. HNIBRBA2951]|uniref:hypothetical protein n=1 Tax=Sulfitobacter aquimarinus TaxID=3158557 RepID=UPI0032DF387B